MTTEARSIIARLRQAGATLTSGSNGRVHFAASAALPADLLAVAREHRSGIAAVLAFAEQPTEACLTCGGGLFWRLSVLSSATGMVGPWTCYVCFPPAPDLWIEPHGMASSATDPASIGGRSAPLQVIS